jgi:hypothetical protein
MRAVHRAFTIAAVGSLLLLCAIIALIARSFFAFDGISRSNWTARPLDDAARAYARTNGGTPRFISRGEGFGLEVWRGRVTFMHGVVMNPMLAWDAEFERKYVNKPNWSLNRRSPDEDGFVPANGTDFSGFWGRLGFGEEVSPTGPGQFYSNYRWTTVPLWPAALAAGVLPVIWVRRRMRDSHRRRDGLCLDCGYDLRGSSGRCPECGAIPVIAGSA